MNAWHMQRRARLLGPHYRRCRAVPARCIDAPFFRPSLQSSDYSYSRVRALNATHLLWEQHSSTLGAVVDRWWLVQHRHGPFDHFNFNARSESVADGLLTPAGSLLS